MARVTLVLAPLFCWAGIVALPACAPASDPMGASSAAPAPKADGFDDQNQPVIPGLAVELAFLKLPTSGAPTHKPWTGWWWPFDHHNDKEKQGIAYAWLPDEPSPAHKYDAAFPAKYRAADWEIANHGQGDNWYGHCDGWSLASATTPEPMVSVASNGVCFRPNDVKALLTESFECDMTGQQVTLLGQECDLTQLDADRSGRVIDVACRDVNPGLFHLTLTNLLGLHGRGLFFDRQTSVEIWNYPISSYTSTVDEPRAPYDAELALAAKGTVKIVEVSTSITFVREKEPSPTREQVESTESYDYTLELDDEGRIIGGEWRGSSQMNHPDALKVPAADARPQHVPGPCNNPYLDFAHVLDLARRSASGAADEC